jgi:hypothetical protein
MINVIVVDGKRYVKDRDNRLVPEDTISPSLLRDDAVCDGIIDRAVNLQRQIDDFRSYVRGEILRRQQRLLPAGTEATEEEILSRSTEMRSFDGASMVMWIVDRKVRADVGKLAACKAALAGIVERITDKMAKRAIAELLNLKSDRSLDYQKIDFLTSLEVEDEGWDICLEELKKCFAPAGQTAYPRCYKRADDGKLELLPLRVSGGERV